MDFQLNDLNVHDLRIVDHCPPHFYPVDFDIRCGNPKKISDWIYENLQGRFFYGEFVEGQGRSANIKQRAAFEIHSEASYFALVLNEINVLKF